MGWWWLFWPGCHPGGGQGWHCWGAGSSPAQPCPTMGDGTKEFSSPTCGPCLVVFVPLVLFVAPVHVKVLFCGSVGQKGSPALLSTCSRKECFAESCWNGCECFRCSTCWPCQQLYKLLLQSNHAVLLKPVGNVTCEVSLLPNAAVALWLVLFMWQKLVEAFRSQEKVLTCLSHHQFLCGDFHPVFHQGI